MKSHTVKIQAIEHVTHDVLRIVTERPQDLTFTPGQATEIAINKSSGADEGKPFTFTSLPEDDYLEFTIKTYPAHEGVTNEMLKLKPNEELILHDVFGAIAYEGEGVFIAGGAGVTPFISIFRNLKANNEIGENKLIFANKTKADIIHEAEFNSLLGDNFINILSEEKIAGYAHGQITVAFLQDHISDATENVYLCGPPPMMDAVEKQLAQLKIDKNRMIMES